MMTDEERIVLKEALERSIADLLEDIESLEEAVQPISPDNAIGRVSRMDAINSKSVNEELLRKSRQRMQLLETALAKVDTEAAGVCVRCGCNIPIGRLLVVPESTRCTSCAAL